MKLAKALTKLSRAVVTAACIIVLAIPQSLLACMGSSGPVCTINPAACLKSMVLTKSVPGPIFPIPSSGSATLVVSNGLFIVCPLTNNCGSTCSNVAVPVSASLNVTLSPPAPPTCPAGSPTLSATISTAAGTMAMPACSSAGTFNFYAVGVAVPGGTCPGLYTVVGTATVTFSDGTVLTQTGDTVICLVPETPGRPGVPRLSVQLLTDSFPRMAPGDQHVATYGVINNDPSNAVTLTAFATSKQGAVRPQGANEAQGVFAISSPFGDDFPILFNPGTSCIPLPPHPYTQATISNTLPVIPPGQTNIINVGIRSYGQCASGSCSESTLRVEGKFSDGSSALGCAGMAFFADTSLPSQSCALQVNDCNHNGIPDALDIASRRSQDQNFNAMPDECEAGIDVPIFSSVAPTNPLPGAPIQVQVAFNESFPMSNVWANGSALVRTQLFSNPFWVGTIPADTRPGPQTVYFLGKDQRGVLASYIALYNVQAPSGPDFDFGAAQLVLTPAGPGLYDVQPYVDVAVAETATNEVPIDYQILVNNTVAYDSRVHTVKHTGNRCIQPGCITPAGGCQVVIHSNVFSGTCVITNNRCFCVGRYAVWPGTGIPIPNGSVVQLVIDPDNVVNELNEYNNDYFMQLLVPPVLSINLSGSNAVISWINEGTLQAASELIGPWTDVSSNSPFSTPVTPTREFYRAVFHRDIQSCVYNVAAVNGTGCPEGLKNGSQICVTACPPKGMATCPNLNTLTYNNTCTITVTRASPNCLPCQLTQFVFKWVDPTAGTITDWP